MFARCWMGDIVDDMENMRGSFCHLEKNDLRIIACLKSKDTVSLRLDLALEMETHTSSAARMMGILMERDVRVFHTRIPIVGRALLAYLQQYPVSQLHLPRAHAHQPAPDVLGFRLGRLCQRSFGAL